MIKNLYICMQQYYGSIGTNFTLNRTKYHQFNFLELGFGKAFGWDLKAEYEVMEHLADRGLIRMNRQLMPYTILKLVTEDELTNNLYSELC